MSRLFLVGIVLVIATTCSASLYDEEVRIVKQLFSKDRDYLKTIRPPGEPTNVTVNMYVRNILALDEVHRTMKIQLTFRQEWEDSRLQFETTEESMKYLPYHRVKDIWVPDLFFKNEIDSEHHELMTDNNLVRIYPNGHVVYSTRVTLELFCPADFHKNEIVCPVTIASYGFTAEEIDIKWKSENPVQVTSALLIPGDYHLNGYDVINCDSTTNMGTFSCVSAEFKFGHSICQA